MQTSVLLEAARGGTRLTIAAQLNLGGETVKTHIKNLTAKTGDASLALAATRLLRETIDEAIRRGR